MSQHELPEHGQPERALYHGEARHHPGEERARAQRLSEEGVGGAEAEDAVGVAGDQVGPVGGQLRRLHLGRV